MKRKAGDLLIQIISVMIGVFLGFIVSNWSQNAKDREKANTLIANIRAEMLQNQEKTATVVSYHKMLRDSTRFYLQQKALEQFSPKFFRGVNTVNLNHSAFDTGVQTGILNDMGLDHLQILNELYSKQEGYDDFTKLMLGGLINMDFSNDEASIRRLLTFLSVSMSDIVYKEEELLRKYEQALDQLQPKEE